MPKISSSFFTIRKLGPSGFSLRFMHAETNAYGRTRDDHTKRRMFSLSRNALACNLLRKEINSIRSSDATANDQVTQIFLAIEKAVKAYCDVKGISHEIDFTKDMSANRVSRVMEAIIAAEKVSKHFSGEALLLKKQYAFESMLTHGESEAIPYYVPADNMGHGTYLQYLHTALATLAATTASTSIDSKDFKDLASHVVIKGIAACYPKGDLTKAPKEKMTMYENPLLSSSTESLESAASSASLSA